MANPNPFTEITPEIKALCELCERNDSIDPSLYAKNDVKRGLRDISGRGVLAGLTNISDIVASKKVNGDDLPCEGRLYYRGYEIGDIVGGFTSAEHFGFEEVVYLLLFGDLPSITELDNFKRLLARYRTLPTGFVRDIIMKAPSRDMMNALARCVLTFYSYDDRADDVTLPNVLRQSLRLISIFPLLAVYSYQAFAHYHDGRSLFIHSPDPQLSTAENLLALLRSDKKYTELEAKILDLALVLHAEHGGGNNSTFTSRVVTSSGTDTYSVIAAALGSLKGPKHGGANIKVVQMFDEMKREISDYSDDEEISDYLMRLLGKRAFDKSGLIYGMGHAVYSLSDPRADILRGYVERLSREKGLHDEYLLYSRVEQLAPKIISRERRIYKGVGANIDFYSGFVYRMLGLPIELFTPIFAVARIAGWSAHRLEELTSAGKIIRPAYKCVLDTRDYLPIGDRQSSDA